MSPGRSTFCLLLACSALAGAAPDSRTPTYASAIEHTAALASDSAAQKRAAGHGLEILNLTWEDTGRFKDSAVGDNISDMTLQVQHADRVNDMPVIRFPNFEDKTADLRVDHFQLLVGNERGGDLHRTNLRDYLGHFRSFLHDPHSWKGERQTLLAKRDEHVLVSAQACFLPIPRQGEARFNPVLFNYQSSAGNPAVLAIVCTREGSSATVIDNTRDGVTSSGGSWGQRLFFNHNGQRASFTGQRVSEHNGSGSARGPAAAGSSGLNMVLLVQVPLKHRPIPARLNAYEAAPATTMTARRSAPSDVEDAVVSHGPIEGPFTEVAGLPIERDPRFPIRVTVQFYKATSNGQVNDKDMAGIAAQIDKVYADGDYVGSLVTEGETGRPTEHSGRKQQPKGWWGDFWRKHNGGR